MSIKHTDNNDLKKRLPLLRQHKQRQQCLLLLKRRQRRRILNDHHDNIQPIINDNNMLSVVVDWMNIFWKASDSNNNNNSNDVRYDYCCHPTIIRRQHRFLSLLSLRCQKKMSSIILFILFPLFINAIGITVVDTSNNVHIMNSTSSASTKTSSKNNSRSGRTRMTTASSLSLSSLSLTEKYERQILMELYQQTTTISMDWYNSTGWFESSSSYSSNDTNHDDIDDTNLIESSNETHNNATIFIHVCEWYGIQCMERDIARNDNITDNADTSTTTFPTITPTATITSDYSNTERIVIGINLSKNNLIIEIIPTSIYTLQSLRYLNLHQNIIYNANFPITAFLLSSSHNRTTTMISPIEYIDLSDCHLLDITGISTLSNTLKELHLSRNGNQFNTRSHFFNRTINITSTSTNNTYTTFPHEILQLTNLHSLSLSMNHIKGTIPYSIIQLSNLENLDLNSNKLSGSIPTSLHTLTKLQYLNLGDNIFTGKYINDNVIPCSNQLRVLNIQGRSYTLMNQYNPNNNNDNDEMKIGGTLPSLPSLFNCTSLHTVLLGNNYFYGTMPTDFLWNTNAGYTAANNDPNNPLGIIQQPALTINLMNNYLSGTIPFDINLIRYDILHIQLTGNTQLQGPIIPDSICTKKSYWMNGLVSKYGCNAILCPIGTYNSIGQQVSKSNPCLPCDVDDATTDSTTSSTTFIGQTTCANSTNNVNMDIIQTNNVNGTNSSSRTSSEKTEPDESTTAMSELRILAELYIAFDGPNRWNTKSGWDELDQFFEHGRTVNDIDSVESSHLINHINHCQFYGIICTGTDNVERITLSDNNMVGIIPTTLFHLPELVAIDFSYNRIRFLTSPNDDINNNNVLDIVDGYNKGNDMMIGFGPLQYTTTLKRIRLSHTEVNTMDNIKNGITLTELYIDGCELSDISLPTELFTLNSLITLHLEASFLTGTIPIDIGKLTNLQRLNLNENSLSGIIPKELGLLTDLEDCDLSDNQFHGELPTEIGSLSRLLSLRISAARGGLGGTLPCLNRLNRIEDLELAFNSFTGTIPNDFLHDRHVDEKRLKIRLTGNLLVGTIPPSFVNFTNLVLELEDNEITALPIELCQNPRWMDGEVGRAMISTNACDAILCPSGTYSPYGRAIINEGINCTECLHNLYYGETVCENEILQRNREVEVLDLLFSATGGRSWTASHTNWTKPGVPICYREGIKCGWKPADMNSGVSEIHLNNFGLQGEIPAEIYELSKLRELSVSFNPVDVPFRGIEKADQLEIINVAYTDVKSVAGIERANSKLFDLHIAGSGLTGPFPTEILQLVSLQKLFLEDNRLNGQLPTEISNLTNLVKLGLKGNDIVGTIPTEIGLLTRLDNLDISLNRLSGFLPSELGRLTKLIVLNLAAQESYSKITGPLYPFDTIPTMQYLNVSQNSLIGKLPTDLLASVNKRSTSSFTVDLSYNSFTGSIPIEFQEFDRLNIDLAANMISGIPLDLCSNTMWMNGIVGVVMQENHCNAILCYPGTYTLTGRQMHRSETCKPCSNISEAPFFGSTGCQNPILKREREELTGFDGWTFKDNWLSDLSVCTWYGIECDSRDYVIGLRLDHNGLKQADGIIGDVIDLLNGLQNLKVLSLDGSDINLDFTMLGNQSALEVLSINSVGLKSLKGIRRLERLQRIIASDNSLTGIFPEDLFSLTNLIEIFLSGNSLQGSIPRNLFRLTKLEILLLQDNKLSGTIPAEIGNLKSLKECMLSGNFLNGSIPSAISDLPILERLSLRGQRAGNHITGTLPDFRLARQLWFLDLSENAINGTIPNTFFNDSQIRERVIEIILDDNRLEGTVPDSLGKFSRLDIRLSNNMIESIPLDLCSKEDWMNGLVGQIGVTNCDVILCPRGYYSQYGRQDVQDDPCVPCTNKIAAQFMGSTSCLEMSERDVLVMLYVNTSGTLWKNNSMWLSDSPICSWYGVRCQGNKLDDKRVISLDLSANGLAGTFPRQVWQLPFVDQIILRENYDLFISFESLVDSSSSIESVDLTQTTTENLNGISSLHNLRNFTISGLTGPFPNDILSLRKLEKLDLSNSYIIGTLPPQLGELTHLTHIIASGNDFHGQVPRELAYLSNLEELVFDENLFSGTLSTAFSALQNLKKLSFSRKIKSGRKLSGPLPTLERVPNLAFISFYGNDFSGTIPDDFLSSSFSLQFLDLTETTLTGTLPERFTSVSNIFVPGYLTSGEKAPNSRLLNEREILQNIFNACGGYFWLRKDFWNTKADICDWYGVGCSNRRVVLLNLENNNVTGFFPPSAFYLSKLQLLWLSNNQVTVTFANIRSASELLDLMLYNTSLKLLTSIGEASSVTRLDLGANNFDDKRFPGGIFRLKNLRVLSMAGNSFFGQLPVSLSSLPYLRSLDLSHNKFNGSVPSWSNNVALNSIRLNNNEFSGQIPDDFLKGVPSFTSISVYMGENKFTGSLPLAFERFEHLVLDLHDNQITSMSANICEKWGWNNEQVGKYGCDGILCPPGTVSPVGRKTDEGSCQRCQLNDKYFGQTKCSDSFTARGSILSTLLWLGLALSLVILFQ